MNIYYENNGKYTTKNSTNRDENAIASAIYNKSYERTVGIFLQLLLMKKMIVNIKMKINLMLWDI